MAKSSKLAEPVEPLATGTDAQAPLDAALDDLIGYALRRAQLKLFQNLINRLAVPNSRPWRSSTRILA